MALPILVWIQDTFLSLVRVNGKSMEPTLQHGDIVVVRKSDFARYHHHQQQTDENINTFDDRDKGNKNSINNQKQQNQQQEDNDKEAKETNLRLKRQHKQNLLRQSVLQYEMKHCNNPSINFVPYYWFYSYPAIPVTDQIVVYRNPQDYYNNNNNAPTNDTSSSSSKWPWLSPSKSSSSPSLMIKRVIGLGGQVVRFLHVVLLCVLFETIIFSSFAYFTLYIHSYGVMKVTIPTPYQLLDRSMKVDGRDNRDDNTEMEEELLRRRQQHYNRSLITSAVTIPPYSLWVEGDNHTVPSYDSRPSPTYKSHGPISKKLVVGIAEYIIWPPSRIGWINQKNDVQNDEDDDDDDAVSTYSSSRRPRAYWP